MRTAELIAADLAPSTAQSSAVRRTKRVASIHDMRCEQFMHSCLKMCCTLQPWTLCCAAWLGASPEASLAAQDWYGDQMAAKLGEYFRAPKPEAQASPVTARDVQEWLHLAER